MPRLTILMKTTWFSAINNKNNNFRSKIHSYHRNYKFHNMNAQPQPQPQPLSADLATLKKGDHDLSSKTQCANTYPECLSFEKNMENEGNFNTKARLDGIEYEISISNQGFRGRSMYGISVHGMDGELKVGQVVLIVY